MPKDTKEQKVTGKIEILADDWKFYPDSLNNQGKLEADIEFLDKSNPATGSVFLKKLPNYSACSDFLRKKDFRKYARCITTMNKI